MASAEGEVVVLAGGTGGAKLARGMLDVAGAHIAIGLLLRRVGEGTRYEVSRALDAKPLSPAVFCYRSEHPVYEGQLSLGELEVLTRSHKDIQTFVEEIRERGRGHGESWVVDDIRWTSMATLEHELEAKLRRDLLGYVGLWLKDAFVNPAAAHAANTFVRSSAG